MSYNDCTLDKHARTSLLMRNRRRASDDSEHCCHRVGDHRVRRLAVEQLDDRDAKRPDVGRCPVSIASDHLHKNGVGPVNMYTTHTHTNKETQHGHSQKTGAPANNALQVTTRSHIYI